MSYQIIWIVFFVVLTILGFAVAAFPVQTCRLIGAPEQIQEKSGIRLVWRGLGGLVFIGSLVELVAVLVVGHVVR